MYIDMMEQILTSTSKVMVDQKSGNSLLYLPLDKLIQSTSAGAVPLLSEEILAANSNRAANSDQQIPARDSLRGRDRGER